MTSVIPRFTTKLFLVLVLFSLVTVASAIVVPNPNIPLDGDVNFFFWNDSSTISATMNRLASYPQNNDTVIKTVTLNATQGQIILGEWAMDPFPYPVTLSPGIIIGDYYANVTSDVGITTLTFTGMIRLANGTNYGPATLGVAAQDINGNTPKLYSMDYARSTYITFPTGSTFVIRVNASTTSTVLRTVSLLIGSPTQPTHVSIGYWQAQPGLDVDTPPAFGSGEIAMAVASGVVGGIFAIAYWKRRFRQ